MAFQPDAGGGGGALTSQLQGPEPRAPPRCGGEALPLQRLSLRPVGRDESEAGAQDRASPQTFSSIGGSHMVVASDVGVWQAGLGWVAPRTTPGVSARPR